MPVDRKKLIQTLQRMKQEYEDAIRNGNYTNLIRSKRLINMLHEFVIDELRNMINDDWIITDKKVYGFPKKKEQDILVQPPQDNERSVTVGPILAVNVRSQLSSIEKNYDTLFERIFAEALNLHNRFPYMVLGYLYLLPRYGYDPEAAKEKKVALTERYDVEKYILSFLSISGRKNPTDVPWKYERVSLLIVDFSQDPPEIIEDMRIFAEKGLVSKKFASMYTFNKLSINTFFDELYKYMMERYYLLIKGD
ncbi:MAG: hypothetical protein DRP55_08250 [Spirochaetes bacterium]|nr:MAG: hypothetical protein DRP55_08250 [Spirochaetota bacterium]